ncbi:MAG: exonuclease SbcCD subunit D, partial [Faecalibacterium sp.]
MRFAHLSDLHLGKRVHEFSMLDDQRYILEQILTLLDRSAVDAVLLAGDLYDKPVPPAEAVRLLDWFLTELSGRGLPVFAISGNHDSADRVAFGARLLEQSRVYVSPAFAGAPTPVTLEDRYGPLDIYLLPFL